MASFFRQRCIYQPSADGNGASGSQAGSTPDEVVVESAGGSAAPIQNLSMIIGLASGFGSLAALALGLYIWFHRRVSFIIQCTKVPRYLPRLVCGLTNMSRPRVPVVCLEVTFLTWIRSLPRHTHLEMLGDQVGIADLLHIYSKSRTCTTTEHCDQHPLHVGLSTEKSDRDRRRGEDSSNVDWCHPHPKLSRMLSSSVLPCPCCRISRATRTCASCSQNRQRATGGTWPPRLFSCPLSRGRQGTFGFHPTACSFRSR